MTKEAVGTMAKTETKHDTIEQFRNTGHRQPHNKSPFFNRIHQIYSCFCICQSLFVVFCVFRFPNCSKVSVFRIVCGWFQFPVFLISVHGILNPSVLLRVSVSLYSFLILRKHSYLGVSFLSIYFLSFLSTLFQKSEPIHMHAHHNLKPQIQHAKPCRP